MNTSGPRFGAAPRTGSGARQNFTPDFLTELFRNPLDSGYHDAAALRARGHAATGWRARTNRAIGWAVLVVIGFLLSVAYLQAIAEQPSRAKVRAGLISQITYREQAVDGLSARADQLRAEVARERDSALSSTTVARLRALEAATGLARVKGSGVVVRVSDGPTGADAVTGEGGTNLGRVLDRDLQDLTNALWGAGAEAIAINGQRLTATSTIRAAGGAILVDFRPVTGPYEVSAIGPDQMERRFEASQAARLLRYLASKYGMGFQVSAADELTLAAAAGPQLHFAHPVPTPASTSAGADPSTSPSGGRR